MGGTVTIVVVRDWCTKAMEGSSAWDPGQGGDLALGLGHGGASSVPRWQGLALMRDHGC
jgi:hypothetical protein